MQHMQMKTSYNVTFVKTTIFIHNQFILILMDGPLLIITRIPLQLNYISDFLDMEADIIFFQASLRKLAEFKTKEKLKM